jgi:hypothetical protein
VVVYKVDRVTRSLADFGKLVDCSINTGCCPCRKSNPHISNRNQLLTVRRSGKLALCGQKLTRVLSNCAPRHELIIPAYAEYSANMIQRRIIFAEHSLCSNVGRPRRAAP